MLDHVLLIPDGNRRWARETGKPPEEVYATVALQITPMVIKYLLIEKNIKEFSIFAVSKNNLIMREKNELDSILRAQISAYEYLQRDSDIVNSKIRFKFVGDLALTPNDYREAAKTLSDLTAQNTSHVCNFLVGYDAQHELVQGINAMIKSGENINENNYKNFLQLKSDIDIVVRTGFEKRLSGAPLLQSRYAELFFCDYYYPDLTKEKIDDIIKEFNSRKRRFGV